MSDTQHPVDDLLRQTAGGREPTNVERDYTAEKLAVVIDRGSQRPRTHHRLALAWTAGGLALVMGVLAAVQLARPTRAEAVMSEIARIVEATEPLNVTDTEFVYTRSTTLTLGFLPREGLGGVAYEKDLLVYQANATRETWHGTQGTVQIRTTNHQPTFFTETDEEAYYAAGLDQRDQINQTITTTDTQPIEEWPSDPEQLDQAIRSQMTTDRGLPEAVEYLDVALDIIGESSAAPNVRAAALRLVSELDGLQFIGEEPDGQATFAVEYTDRGVQTRLTFVVDPNGHIRHEDILNITADDQYGIPARTPIYQAEIDEPVIRRTLD